MVSSLCLLENCKPAGKIVRMFAYVPITCDGNEGFYIPVHFHDMQVLSAYSFYGNELRNLCARFEFFNSKILINLDVT
jgi:hypothetical protein